MVEMLDAARVRIVSSDDIRRAAEALRDAARSMFPCRVAPCANIAGKHQMRDGNDELLVTTVFGWTDSEEDRWWRTSRLALDSPLPTACRYESEPYWCNADGFRTTHHNPLLDRIDLHHFEQRCMTRAALVVPVHMPFGQIGAVSFVPDDPGHIDLSREFELYGDMLGLFARSFISGYVRIMVQAERLPVGPVLSKREVECLRWAAIGKTDMEIGMILERSRATVRFHIHNAAAKLDAVNRSQTLFKATQLGYIGLNS